MSCLEETEINNVRDFLVKKINPFMIILFGSGAKGKMSPNSDIDIAFLTDRRLEDYETFMMAQELAAQVKREVDLVNLEKASTVFKAQIVGTGKVIYDRDPYRRMLFQMRSLKAYAKLNEERQPILEKIKTKGSIFDE